MLRPVVAVDAVHLPARSDFSRALETRRAWLKLVEGHLFVCGAELHAGEGVLLEDETPLAAYAEADSLLLIFELERSR